MTTAPATETVYDTLIPDPRTVYALRRVICEQGAYIDERGNLWVVNPAARFNSPERYRLLLHVHWLVVAKLLLSGGVEWNEKRWCYMKAQS